VKRSSRTHRTGTGHKRLWGHVLQYVGGEPRLRPTRYLNREIIHVKISLVSSKARARREAPRVTSYQLPVNDQAPNPIMIMRLTHHE